MRLKSLSRTGSASAAKPLDKSTASRVLRNASVTGEQQFSVVCVILITVNIANNMEVVVSRFQLALNVSNLAEAIEFYSKMFNATPAKVREGYANFAIADPPLKLVLIETPRDVMAEYQHLNHLGVELETTAQVESSIERFEQLGLVDSVEKDKTCCYAVQDKVWMQSPDGAPWEYYTVLSDAPTFHATIDQKCC